MQHYGERLFIRRSALAVDDPGRLCMADLMRFDAFETELLTMSPSLTAI